MAGEIDRAADQAGHGQGRLVEDLLAAVGTPPGGDGRFGQDQRALAGPLDGRQHARRRLRPANNSRARPAAGARTQPSACTEISPAGGCSAAARPGRSSCRAPSPCSSGPVPRNVTRLMRMRHRLVDPRAMVQPQHRSRAQVQRIGHVHAQGAERAAVDGDRHVAEHAIAQSQLPAGQGQGRGGRIGRMGPRDGARPPSAAAVALGTCSPEIRRGRRGAEGWPRRRPPDASRRNRCSRSGRDPTATIRPAGGTATGRPLARRPTDTLPRLQPYGTLPRPSCRRAPSRAGPSGWAPATLFRSVLVGFVLRTWQA